MARNILAQLVIALRDNVSGGAQKAADSLNKIKKAAEDINKAGGKGGLNGLSAGLDKAAKSAKDLADAGVRLRDWGGNFDRRLQRLKISGAELDELRRKFADFNKTLDTMGSRRLQGSALANWKNEALANLLRVRAEAQNVDRAINRIGSNAGSGIRSLRREMSLLTQTLGFGTGVYATQRGAREAVEGGAQIVRGNIRGRNLGLSPIEQASLTAQSLALSQRYPSLSMEQIRTTGRQLIPNVGSFPVAQELLPDFIRARVALKTIDGTGADEGEMEKFSRAIDILGRSMDPAATRALLDAYIRSRQMDPAAIKADDWLSFAQTGGGAAKGLGVDFLSTVLPALMSQKKGYRTGTDFASAWQNFIIGRGTGRALMAQNDFISATGKSGLREGLVMGPRGRVIKPGTLVDSEMFIQNPFEWSKKHLIPRLVKDGILPEGWAKGDYSTDMSPEQRAKLQPALSNMLSNRRGFEFFSTLLGDLDQIQKYIDNLQKAAGTANVDADQMKDPFVAWQSVLTQLKELGAAVTAPALEAAAPILHSIAGALRTMATALQENPDIANLTLVAGGILAFGAAVKTVGNILRGLGFITAAATGAGAGAAAGAGGAGAAAASRLPMLARGMSFVPGIGWIATGAALGYGIYSGGNDVAPGDLSEAEQIAQARARRWYRPNAPSLSSLGIGSSIGASGLNQFGLGGLAPRTDVPGWNTIRPKVEVEGLDAASNVFDLIKEKIDEVNGKTATPRMNTTDLERGVGLLDSMLSKLAQVESGAARATNSVRAAVRAAYSDYGMEESG